MTAPPLVLVVDDDASILRALERALRLEGFEVLTAPGGHEALEAVGNRTPQAVVLDVTMPDVDGITVLRRLRGAGDDVPVLVLSARDGLDDRVAGLRAGADDYLVKPFALAELVARLQALLRRRAPTSVPVREVGRLRVDRARHVARVDGEEVDLTHREFELLACLADHAGMVLSRRQLLEQVWGYDFDAQTNVVEVFVSYLRRKLEAGGRDRLVHTVRGRGYVLRA